VSKIETTDPSIALRTCVSRPHHASNKPGTCLWCGRKLRLKCHTKTTRAPGFLPPNKTCCTSPDWKLVDETFGRFECGHCGEEAWGARRTTIVSRTPTFEGAARGDYGDNAFCGLRCGYAFGVTMAGHGHRIAPREGDETT
jgi:hypothetical protein